MVHLIAMNHDYYDEMYRLARSFYPTEIIQNGKKNEEATEDTTVIFSHFDKGKLTTEIINPFGEVVSTDTYPVSHKISQRDVAEGMRRCFTNFDLNR